jgi:hypothetical protein
MPKTTILLETETRQLLRKIGRKEQTYDDLIRELAVKHNTCPKCGDIIKEELSGRGLAPATRRTPTKNTQTEQSTGGHD